MASFHRHIVAPPGADVQKPIGLQVTEQAAFANKIRQQLLKIEGNPYKFELEIPNHPRISLILERFGSTSAFAIWGRRRAQGSEPTREYRMQAMSLMLSGLDQQADLEVIKKLDGVFPPGAELPFPPELPQQLRDDPRRPMLCIVLADVESGNDPAIRFAAETLAHAFFDMFGAELPIARDSETGEVQQEETIFEGRTSFSSSLEVRPVKIEPVGEQPMPAVFIRIGDASTVSSHVMKMQEAGQLAVNLFAALAALGDVNAQRILDLVFKRKSG